jgi:peptide/nickel transport system substrate-binding protein
MKPRLIVSVTVLVLALALGAGAGSSATGAASIPLLRVGTTGGASTLDPASHTGWWFAGGLETLMQFGPNGKIRPWLAQSISQPGRATYVYHLRRGVKFWDGSEMTSADVANSLNSD